MTDDIPRSAADSGDPADVADAPDVPTSGVDAAEGRRSVVYLVPAVSGPAVSGPAVSGAAGSGPADSEPDEPSASACTSGSASPTAQRGETEGPGLGAASPPSDAPDLGIELDAEQPEREDWAWVQEWRAGQEPTPWATGIALAVFSALVVGVAVWVLSAGLADRPVIAILVNLLVAAGLTPAIWLSRGLPVLRWIAAGAAAGIIIGWISAILMLPLPTA